MNEGFKYWFKDENLVTVWSAPNYCYRYPFLLTICRCGNKAAILKVGYNLERTFDIFNAVPESSHSPHPKTIVPYFL